MTATKCPNCGSSSTWQYIHESDGEYAFTACDDCREEFDEDDS